MKDGTTPYKPEHACAVVAAELHPADEGVLPKTLAAAEANLEAVDVAPTAEIRRMCDHKGPPRLVLETAPGRAGFRAPEGCALARR